MSDFQLLIDRQMVGDDRVSNVINPSTEAVVAQCPRAAEAQVSAAVAAAKRAFQASSGLPMDVRRQALAAVADVIDAKAARLPKARATSFGRQSCATSPMERGWWTRSNSAPCSP